LFFLPDRCDARLFLFPLSFFFFFPPFSSLFLARTKWQGGITGSIRFAPPPSFFPTSQQGCYEHTCFLFSFSFFFSFPSFAFGFNNKGLGRGRTGPRPPLFFFSIFFDGSSTLFFSCFFFSDTEEIRERNSDNIR